MTTAMEEVLEETASRQKVDRMSADIFAEQRQKSFRQVDRVFACLMLGQWAFAVLLALLVSPASWEGKVRAVHLHVQAAVFLGGILSAFPVSLALLRPGRASTRHVVAAAQMLWSALLIHLTGGRIETHFHVFGFLAFLAFYLDWPVLATATVFVAADHFIRGLLWPESVYGIANPEWWRFLEHAGWVVFENSVLIAFCVKGAQALKDSSERQAQVEFLADLTRSRMAALEMALAEIKKPS